MKPRNPTEIVALMGRVLLGVWFVYSGGLKLWVTGLDQFTKDIGNYQLVNAPWDAVAAYTVPWLELVAGLALMLGVWRRGAIAVIFFLVLGFSAFVGWAWYHQLDISCGCLGSKEPIRYWAKAVEFVAYFVVLAGLWWAEGKSSNRIIK